MTAQKRQKLMFAILIVSVLFGLVMKPWERRKPAVVVQQNGPVEIAVATAQEASALTEVVYVSEWPARDPFKQPDEKSTMVATMAVAEVSLGTPSFALQGIMTVDGQLACVIDGMTRVVGAQVSGWRVEKIEAQGVWVSQGGERHFVPMQ